ncbi:MAG: hypothetical protein ACREH8_00685 [Opitutaceae bacterium]
MEAGLPRIEQRLEAEPDANLKALEAAPRLDRFPSAILAAAVLYASPYAANRGRGDPRWLALALRIGDLLASENEKGRFDRGRHLSYHRDVYLWLDAYRLIEDRLGAERRARWRKELEKCVDVLAREVAPRAEFPRYHEPGYVGTGTNHYAVWAKTVYLAGRMFGTQGWESLGARVMHRLSAEMQTPDGYWGEFSDAGPTTGYNYLTFVAIALYAEHSADPAAPAAVRRGTDFHKHFTWADGIPVEVVDDRSRYWSWKYWGHFGFSRFPDGRRLAEFLTGFIDERYLDPQTLGRIARNGGRESVRF